MKRIKKDWNAGENAASPTIPPRMATAFRPICTTVKNRPGISCSFITREALTFPSSANCLSFILREAASDISESEKKALIAISKRISKILFNIIYPFNTGVNRQERHSLFLLLIDDSAQRHFNL